VSGYTLQRELGTGGMAEVWYAENKLGKRAAVKILSKKLSDDENIKVRFESEARVMVKLNHPNIRQVYDYGMIEERPCIIMEYLDGEDLGTLIKKGGEFSQEQIIRWWNQMSSALNYTHGQGVVHRDIKPSNIFITNEGNVELLDFGIAKVADNYLSTMSGMSMGTPMYMSPEQVISSKHIDYRSDVYSLAVTFVHLLGGKAPYSSDMSVYNLHKSIVEEPLDLSGIPLEWREFLSPYLAKQPEARPQLMEYCISDTDDTKISEPKIVSKKEEISEPKTNVEPKATSKPKTKAEPTTTDETLKDVGTKIDNKSAGKENPRISKSPDPNRRKSSRKVAILEVVDKEGSVPYGMKLMIKGTLAFMITNTPGYEGYDRVDISSIMNEQDFQRTGMVNDAQIKKLGEMTGASFVLVAEVAKLDESHIIIVANILNVETAKLEQTSNIQTSTEINAMEGACKELASRLLKSQSVAIGNSSSKESSSNANMQGSDFIETTLGLNMKMVYVEGGEFLMGATGEQGSDARSNEYPVRRVRLDSYYIAECEVTQGQWEKVMGTSIHQQASEARFSTMHGVGKDYPMYYVSWEEAQAFCRELSRITGRTYCLPTEAQWEYAARGGVKGGNDKTKYSGTWSLDAVAWYDSNSGNRTHIVKTKKPNELGLYDMSGNVWEWCSDKYGSYNANDLNNPMGASSGSYRVLRGGSWYHYASTCRVSYRYGNTPRDRDCYCGFRVVVLP